jgi:hypothetical protein
VVGMIISFYPRPFQALGTSRLSVIGFSFLMTGFITISLFGGNTREDSINLDKILVSYDVVVSVAFGIGMIFAVVITNRAVRKLCSTEEIFYRYVNPSLVKVRVICVVGNAVIAAVTAFVLFRMFLLPTIPGFVAAEITAALLTYFVGFQYAMRVFTQNIHKGSFNYRDFNIFDQ